VTASHQTRSRYAASLTLVAALALLTGCSVFKKKEVRTCPRVEIVEGLNRLIKFGDGPGRDPSDILYAARINDARSECDHDGQVRQKQCAIYAARRNTRAPRTVGPSNRPSSCRRNAQSTKWHRLVSARRS